MVAQRFNRLEATYMPVEAKEGFEVVRRRLFLDCQDNQAREHAAREFVNMYANNANDFPVETKDINYMNRIISCYPIHPELFDRLYNDWSTLKDFQRTRGVLKLMAALIHELWMNEDSSALIMPGSMIFNNTIIREQLIRNLDGHDTWNAVIDNEIDGSNSLAYKTDQNTPHFGSKAAARRAARAVMLGSAPSSSGVSANKIRGIDIKNIILGVIQPGEAISDFKDALNELQNASAYLYQDNSRYWYDTTPTLRKTAADRAKSKSDLDADAEIKRRLHSISGSANFAGVHKCPSSSSDVPDRQDLRLVILPPEFYYYNLQGDNKALEFCRDILEHRGPALRSYKNMLAFVAADKNALEDLRDEIKFYLAWKSIDNDRELLNLGVNQIRETESNIKKCNDAAAKKLKEAWSWLIVPREDINKLNDIKLNASRLSIDEDNNINNIVKAAAEAMQREGTLVKKLIPMLLKQELDKLFWRDKDYINIKTLWEDLCKYCYNYRLAGFSVLADAISAGVAADLQGEVYFALASGIDKDGKYINLKYKEIIRPDAVSPSDYIVKLDAALKQLEELKKELKHETPKNIIEPAVKNVNKPKPKHFALRVSLKADNFLDKNFKAINENIISQLAGIKNAGLDIELKVNMTAPEGLPDYIVRALAENCNTLKLEDFKIYE